MNHSAATNDFPWGLAILVLGYVILEIFAIFKQKKLYSILIIEHLIGCLKKIRDEIKSETLGEVVCGYVLGFIVLGGIVILALSIHIGITHYEALAQIVFILIIFLFLISFFMAFSWANMHFISWCKNKSSKL